VSEIPKLGFSRFVAPPSISLTVPTVASGRLCDGTTMVITGSEYDDLPGYDVGTGFWTCPTTGRYTLSFFVSLESSDGTDGWRGPITNPVTILPGVITAGLVSSTGCDYYVVNNYTCNVISKYASVSGAITRNIIAGAIIRLSVINPTNQDYTAVASDTARFSVQKVE